MKNNSINHLINLNIINNFQAEIEARRKIKISQTSSRAEKSIRKRLSQILKMDPSQAHVIQTISSRLATTIGLTEYLTDDLKHQILENVINNLIVQRILITPLQIVRATHFINNLLTKHQQRQQ